jgi:hypothetical protein
MIQFRVSPARGMDQLIVCGELAKELARSLLPALSRLTALPRDERSARTAVSDTLDLRSLVMLR